MSDSLHAVVRFVDSGEQMNDGDIGYGIVWRNGVIEGLRRRGDALYTEDVDGVHRGGFYPSGATRADKIIFASFDLACEARDAASVRIDETIIGFAETLRRHYARKREESNAPADLPAVAGKVRRDVGLQSERK